MLWQDLSSYIKFSSHLFVGLIDEHFGQYLYDQIVFSMRVKVAIVDANIASGNSTTVDKNVQFVFKPVEPILDQPVPRWAYIIGTLIGLLIIILLVILLWKV